MIKRIHVNQHTIRANNTTNEKMPPLSVKTYNSNTLCYEVTVLGPSKIVYSPDKPLSCGAKVWIETEAEVIMETEQ
jgi:hypothetical protein